MNFIPEQPHHSLSEGLCYTLSQGCRINVGIIWPGGDLVIRKAGSRTLREQ
ncbi:MAG: hypothetical protein J6A27_06240 [Bacteroidales bacterium]|nr:hypothetical protein [Bacteroidales bacterium]